MAFHDWRCEDCKTVVEVEFRVGQDYDPPTCPSLAFSLELTGDAETGAVLSDPSAVAAIREAMAETHAMKKLFNRVSGWVIW